MLSKLAHLACSVFVILTAVAAEQTSTDLQPAIAGIVAKHLTPEGPGAVVAVVHRGKTVVLHAAGKANLDYGVPLTADSRFYLGSLAKQFTAANVASLVADGRLTLDDPIGKYVADLPPAAAGIPLGQLLHHRSGIRDYLKIRDLNGEKDEPFDNPEALAIIRRQQSLVFAPGARYQYSNSNYILLAEVVRAVSGESLASFAASKVFAPAGMPATFFETDATAVVPDRVVSYSAGREGRWHRHVKQFDAIGDGGAYSSMHDLLRWDAVIRERSVFPEAVFTVLLMRPRTASRRTGAVSCFGPSWARLPPSTAVSCSAFNTTICGRNVPQWRDPARRPPLGRERHAAHSSGDLPRRADDEARSLAFHRHRR